MRELLFIRHGQSIWNAEGRWQGQANPPLTELGRRQALALAERLAGLGVALLATSDLARASETAAIVAARLGVEPRVEPDLRELDVGAWSGLTREEIAARFPAELQRFRAGDVGLRPGGGESRLAFRARVLEAIARLRARSRGTLAVVSHLGVLRALEPGARLEPGELVRVSPRDLEWAEPAQLGGGGLAAIARAARARHTLGAGGAGGGTARPRRSSGPAG